MAETDATQVKTTSEADLRIFDVLKTGYADPRDQTREWGLALIADAAAKCAG
jgi:hypothetical protein